MVSPSKTPLTIRIFVSSPGDVEDERDRARQVVDSLRRRYAGRLELKHLLWEDLPLQPDTSFQDGIDKILLERSVDIALFILWSRLGTPTGPLQFNEISRKTYRSGTERELDLMLEARKQSRERLGKAKPDILVYVRKDQASFDERLRGKTTDEQDAIIAQKKLTEAFVSEQFKDSESGTNIGAYHSFDRPVTFARRVRQHLEEILDPLAGIESGVPVWDIAKQGLPFLGLAAYQFHHASVFFGREDEIVTVRHHLRKRAQEGCAFVLISGSSGSGKSSLARAGVLPAVVEHEVDSLVERWRYVVFTPGELGLRPLAGLAAKLAETLPALKPDQTTFSDFADQLRLNPAFAWRQFIAKAFRPRERLIVLVDQLEELVTNSSIPDGERTAFADALEMLARSGSVWVLATMRSDFSHLCQHVPGLLRLRQDGDEIDLLPPTADAISRVITDPARLAGLYYEERGGVKLSDVLLREATERRELLPFLSHVLSRLTEEREMDGKLTFDAFEQRICHIPGGTSKNSSSLEGALGVYADEVFSTVPKEAQASLTGIWPKLITLDGNDGGQALRQYPKLREVTAVPAAKPLVDAFVNARLFTVSGEEISGGPTLTVVHETLLRSWGKASEWVNANRRHLQMRSNVRAFQARWFKSAPAVGGRDASLLLPPGLPLEEGATLLAEAPELLTGENGEATRDYILRSRAYHQAQQERLRKLRGVVTFSLLSLTVVALALAGVAILGMQKAIASRDEARVHSGNLALEKANHRPVLYPDQIFHRARAIGFAGYGGTNRAGKFFQEGLQLLRSSEEPFPVLLPERVDQTQRELAALPAYLPVWRSESYAGGAVTGLAFTEGDCLLRVKFADGTGKEWDLRTPDTAPAAFQAAIAGTPESTGVSLSADRVAIRCYGRSLELAGFPGKVNQWALSADKKRLALGLANGSVTIWDVSGRPLKQSVNLLTWIEHGWFEFDDQQNIVAGNWKEAEQLPAAWEPAGPARLTPELRAPYRNSLGMSLLFVPPGEFLMGSPVEENEREELDHELQHAVRLTHGFWLGEFEVTQAEWIALMGSNPSTRKDPLAPVTDVSWNDAMSYCDKLTQQERTAGVLPPGYIYTLPTEAQWEYACRAGTTTPFSFGSALDGTQANVNGSLPYGTSKNGPNLTQTLAVGSYEANPWGFYDMHGNVYEWCQDWRRTYAPAANGKPLEDPPGDDSGSYRIFRGGSWVNRGKDCRSAKREMNLPGRKFDFLGFRLAAVRAPSQ